MPAFRLTKARPVGDAEPLGQLLDDEMVGAHIVGRVDELRPEQDVALPAAAIDVVVFEEHRRRQDEIGHLRRVGHELFVDAGEEVVARKALAHQPLLGRDVHRVGVLDQHGRHGHPARQRLGIAGQDAADLRLVKMAHRRVAIFVPLDDALVQVPDGAVVVETAATLILPVAEDGRHAKRGVHCHRAVALAREAVAEPEEGARRRSDEGREGLDLLDGEAGDPGRPLRRAGEKMRLQPGRVVGVSGEVVAIRRPIAKGDVHQRAGERGVGAGLQLQRQIRLLHGRVVVDVDDHDPGAAFLAGADRVRHHVDLRRHRIGAPDDDTVRQRHLARIDTHQFAGPGDEAGPGGVGADGIELVGIALGVAQPMDAVALHEAHRAGVKVRPDGLGAVKSFGLEEFLGNEIQRVAPADVGPFARAFGALAPHRLHQAVGMMHPLGIARDLGADDAGRVAVVGSAPHPSDRAGVEDVDLQRAGGGAVMRADGESRLVVERLVHGRLIANRAAAPKFISQMPAINAKGRAHWPAFRTFLQRRFKPPGRSGRALPASVRDSRHTLPRRRRRRSPDPNR